MKRVVIVGAGPAGLLAAIVLLRRNHTTTTTTTTDEQQQQSMKYHVTLIDPGVNYGLLDENDLKRFRSWMIGLSCHGLDAIQTIPNLFETYVSQLGIELTSATFAIGSSSLLKFTYDVNANNLNDYAFTVDRNYICGALARYLYDHYGPSDDSDSTDPNDDDKSNKGKQQQRRSSNNKYFVSKYETCALYVDGRTKYVMVRKTNGNNSTNGSSDATTTTTTTNTKDVEVPPMMEAIPYDILLGCDGIRSVVRNAFITNHREFEFDIRGSFGRGKSIHLTRPTNIAEGRFMFLANCVPNVSAFVLPERGGMLNFAAGHVLTTPCDVQLQSDDPSVVSNYFRTHFHAFDDDDNNNNNTMDYDEMGREWVKQSWSTTQMVHCNFYHSHKLQALLLGDAAHATTPNIGQGMNTALADAVVLNDLLDKYDDDWDAVLPAFSKLRVKEGNALTDLSFHSFSLSPWMQVSIIVRQNVRRFLNRRLPYWIVAPEPMLQISRGMTLSVAYDQMIRLGYLQRSRRINTEIMQCHFERTHGMVVVKKDDEGMSRWRQASILMIGAAVAAFYIRKK